MFQQIWHIFETVADDWDNFTSGSSLLEVDLKRVLSDPRKILRN